MNMGQCKQYAEPDVHRGQMDGKQETSTWCTSRARGVCPPGRSGVENSGRPYLDRDISTVNGIEELHAKHSGSSSTNRLINATVADLDLLTDDEGDAQRANGGGSLLMHQKQPQNSERQLHRVNCNSKHTEDSLMSFTESSFKLDAETAQPNTDHQLNGNKSRSEGTTALLNQYPPNDVSVQLQPRDVDSRQIYVQDLDEGQKQRAQLGNVSKKAEVLFNQEVATCTTSWARSLSDTDMNRQPTPLHNRTEVAFKRSHSDCDVVETKKNKPSHLVHSSQLERMPKFILIADKTRLKATRSGERNLDKYAMSTSIQSPSEISQLNNSSSSEHSTKLSTMKSDMSNRSLHSLTSILVRRPQKPNTRQVSFSYIDPESGQEVIKNPLSEDDLHHRSNSANSDTDELSSLGESSLQEEPFPSDVDYEEVPCSDTDEHVDFNSSDWYSMENDRYTPDNTASNVTDTTNATVDKNTDNLHTDDSDEATMKTDSLECTPSSSSHNGDGANKSNNATKFTAIPDANERPATPLDGHQISTRDVHSESHVQMRETYQAAVWCSTPVSILDEINMNSQKCQPLDGRRIEIEGRQSSVCMRGASSQQAANVTDYKVKKVMSKPKVSKDPLSPNPNDISKKEDSVINSIPKRHATRCQQIGNLHRQPYLNTGYGRSHVFVMPSQQHTNFTDQSIQKKQQNDEHIQRRSKRSKATSTSMSKDVTADIGSTSHRSMIIPNLRDLTHGANYIHVAAKKYLFH